MEEYQKPLILKPRQLSDEEIDRVCKRAYEDAQKAEYEARIETERIRRG